MERKGEVIKKAKKKYAELMDTQKTNRHNQDLNFKEPKQHKPMSTSSSGCKADVSKPAEINHKNNLNFFKSIFLVCPLCGEDVGIEKIKGNSIITKCSCTGWKIDFKITEHP